MEDNKLLEFCVFRFNELFLNPFRNVDEENDSDDELLLWLLNGSRAKKPKVDHYLDVVAEYSDEEVCLCYINQVNVIKSVLFFVFTVQKKTFV